MDFRMQTGWALLGGGIGGKACYTQPKGMGAGGFGGGGGGCAAGGGGGGFAGVYVFKILEMTDNMYFYNTAFCVGYIRNYIMAMEFEKIFEEVLMASFYIL